MKKNLENICMKLGAVEATFREFIPIREINHLFKINDNYN